MTVAFSLYGTPFLRRYPARRLVVTTLSDPFRGGPGEAPPRPELAGAGVKGGVSHGETDEYGIRITKDPVHVHDYHATILHLMGLDHTQLTYRYAGRDFRLTDVAGNVIKPILT